MESDEQKDPGEQVKVSPMFFMESEAVEETREFFLFELDGELYSVAVGDVDQVLKIPPITTVPNAPGSILGIFHLRGRVIVALDLLKRMNLPRKTALSPYYLFVAHREKEYFAIVIDRIRTVVRIPLRDILELDPLVAARVPPRYAQGMFMYKDRELRDKKGIGPDIMIEPKSSEEGKPREELPLRPVLWLNIQELLNQKDLLGLNKTSDLEQEVA